MTDLEIDDQPSELERTNVPETHGVLLEHHVPETFNSTFHYHPSIEVNFLDGCEMTYSFSGREVVVKPGHFVVFWAAYPHQVTHVAGKGTITNAYLQLSEILQWPLPKEFLNLLMAGAVVSNRERDPSDLSLTKKWAREMHVQNRDWRTMHTLEIQARLARLAIVDQEIILPAVYKQKIGRHSRHLVSHFDMMLRFISEHYAQPITLKRVADAANISTNHATTIFRKFLGCTVKQHINNVRLFHAKMMLAESDHKILTVALDSGFGSVSAFYEVFQDRIGKSPAAFREHPDQL